MDKLTQTRLISEVRAAVTAALETGSERWVSDETLMKHFEKITKTWLRSYKHILHPVKIPGTKGWSYPLNQIQRRLNDGSLFEDLVRAGAKVDVLA